MVDCLTADKLRTSQFAKEPQIPAQNQNHESDRPVRNVVRREGPCFALLHLVISCSRTVVYSFGAPIRGIDNSQLKLIRYFQLIQSTNETMAREQTFIAIKPDGVQRGKCDVCAFS